MNDQNHQDNSIEAYRATYKELDRIWSMCSKACGLSDAEYWALHMIREGCRTQTEISEQLSMNKQTVHSALKMLIKKDMVRLETKQNNLREKQIIMTETGQKFARTYIDRMHDIEEEAWNALKLEERELLVLVSQKYNALLEPALRRYLAEKSSAAEL